MKKPLKISLICPVYNEEDNIARLIKSMLNQTKRPNEIIFVDNLSKDRTAKIIKEYSKKNKIIRIIEKKSNIAEARNIAVKSAKNEIIACTDASSKLKKDWLEEITKPFFDSSVDVVSGGYVGISNGGIQDYIQMLTIRPMNEWNEKDFLPSGRSVAFRKSIWKKAGGYPENFLTGEDTLFGLNLRKVRAKFVLNKKAIVYWEVRRSLKKFAKQFYLYGKGDKKMGNLLKMKKNLLLILFFWLFLGTTIVLSFVNLSFGLIFFLLGFVPSVLQGMKWFLKTKRAGCLIFVPFLHLLKRISYILGASFG